MRDITIASPFVRQALIGAEAAGYDTKRTLRECGIAPKLLERPQARVALDNFVLLQQRLMVLMNDEALGLLEKPQRLGSFALVARAVLHCENIGEVLEKTARYNNLFEVGFVHQLRKNRQGNSEQWEYSFQRREPQHIKSHFIAESSAMTLHRFVCWLAGARIPLKAVHLDYSAPEWRNEYRYVFYGFPVSFQQSATRLIFRAEDMALPVQQNLSALETYLARAPRDVFTPEANLTHSHQVRREILKQLQKHSKVPSIEDTADRLKLHPQSLRRRLRQEGTDYTELRNQARRDAAIYFLSRENIGIEQISEQLGFSESSAFIRAFKAWTGMTPLAYRKAAH